MGFVVAEQLFRIHRLNDKKPFPVIGNLKLVGVRSPRILIDGYQIEKLNFVKMLTSEHAEVSNCKISHYSFLDFRVDGQLDIHNCISNQGKGELLKFRTLRSQFENVNFSNCDFDTYKLIAGDSDFTKLEYGNVQWPKKIKPITKGDYKQEQEYYRQFKVLSKRNHNSIDERHYSGRERHAHLKRLVLSRAPFFKKWSLSNISSIISLSFLWGTSKYGLSWIQAAIIYLAVTMIIFYSLTYSEVGEIKGRLDEYVRFLNPVHDAKTVISKDISENGIVWDWVGRVVNILFLYQVVAAWKKFDKN